MRILILMYHMISETEYPYGKRYTLPPERFKRQMWYLKYRGYTPIGMDKVHNYFTNKADSFPKKPVVITFDDGYMDNYENAFPILKEFDFPATVFVASGLVGKVNNWMGNEGYPERKLMGWREVDEIKKFGIAIGSHTVSHHRLSLLRPEDARKEIEESKNILEDRLGIQIDHFAYPYGDKNESIVSMVRESGYKTACSTRSGFNSENVSLFELRRLDIYGTDSILRFAIKLTYGTNDGDFLLPAKYYRNRIIEKVSQWI